MQKLSFSRFVVPGIAGIMGAMAADFIFAPMVRANVPGWSGLAGGFWWRLSFAILFGFAAGRLVRRNDLWSVRFPQKGPKLSEWAAIAGILFVTAAVLFPVFAQVRECSRRASCLRNAKQLGLATLMYAQDYDDKLFPVSYRRGGERAYWFGAGSLNGDSYRCTDGFLYPYLKNERLFECPNARREKLPTLSPTGETATGKMTAYGLNRDGLYARSAKNPFSFTPPLLTQCDAPAETILFADAATRQPSANGGLARTYLLNLPSSPEGSTLHARHDGIASIVWADGHANLRIPRPDSDEKRLGFIRPLDGGIATPDYYFLLHKSSGTKGP